MVKVFALIPRRVDISERQFHDHWAGPHAQLALRITTLRRYVQSHRVAPKLDGLPEPPYDGIAEVWFDDAEAAASMGEDPNYVDHAHADEPNFIDTEQLSFIATEEQVLRAGSPPAKDAGGIKAMILLARIDPLSPRDLAQRLQGLGEDLVALLPGAQRIVIAVTVPESYADGAEPTFDAVLELWFDDRDAFEEAWRSSGESLLGRLDSVADPFRSCGMLAEEQRVIWPDDEPASVSGTPPAHGAPAR
jgi:uncharacterized protein (TIGR02118 family)